MIGSKMFRIAIRDKRFCLEVGVVSQLTPKTKMPSKVLSKLTGTETPSGLWEDTIDAAIRREMVSWMQSAKGVNSALWALFHKGEKPNDPIRIAEICSLLLRLRATLRRHGITTSKPWTVIKPLPDGRER